MGKEAVPPVLYQPDTAATEKSHIRQYQQWLEKRGICRCSDYEALWKWSTEHWEAFWTTLYEYFQIRYDGSPIPATDGATMPHTRWFEKVHLNYAEHIFLQKSHERPALLFQSERHDLIEVSWQTLERQTASLAAWLRDAGIQKGDRIAAYLPTIPEATVALLASMSIGAIWSSCSPDFGTGSVVDRFSQIEPRILIAVDGYSYGGKSFDRTAIVKEIASQLPTLEHIIFIPYLDSQATISGLANVVHWEDTMRRSDAVLSFERVEFMHPVWILYSSGTTGIPKAIVHSQGGVLLEHLKYLHFHNDVHAGDIFFWFTTTGWMMWNFLHGALLAGATIVLYDGSPGYPDLMALWKLAAKAGITHFGTSAPFLVACMKEGIQPGKDTDLHALRSIGSTGSPLPPEAFAYTDSHIKHRIWLSSMSGGTDVCTAWIGGNPLLPVYEGEIQCRCLGCAMESWSDSGASLINEVGEMIIKLPMPSMPVFFWNDLDQKKYLGSYFEDFQGIWRHGDWIRITDRGTLVILGRSDATLNRQGIRIGTAEIYRAIDKIVEIKDSLIVCVEYANGEQFMPLFVVMQDGLSLSPEIEKKIRNQLRNEYSPRHIPDTIIAVADIPYTMSGKKMESPVKKILMGFPVEKSANMDAVRNPGSLDFFIEYRKTMVNP